MDIVEKARVYASAAHAAVKQLRKYTNEPYMVHPTEVAAIVSTVPHTPEMLAAAYLHDVVEDTGVTNEDITREFGNKIGEYVGWLTKISRPEYGNRHFRYQMDRAHLAQAPADVKTVKIADIISNAKSIKQYDPNFAVVYLEEKRGELEVLNEGDATLHARASALVKE